MNQELLETIQSISRVEMQLKVLYQRALTIAIEGEEPQPKQQQPQSFFDYCMQHASDPDGDFCRLALWDQRFPWGGKFAEILKYCEERYGQPIVAQFRRTYLFGFLRQKSTDRHYL